MFKTIKPSRVTSVINLALFLSFSTLALAEQVWAKNKNSNSNVGLPVRRIGGGTRRECVQTQTAEKTQPQALPLKDGERMPESQDHSILTCPSLIALIPENLVITSTQSPTLLFYIPALGNAQNIQLEFVLRDNQDQLVYETSFTTSGKAGIINFQIPSSEKFQGLKTDQNYHWYLSIIYNSVDRAHDDVVEGWLRHTSLSPSLVSQLAQATSIERVNLYQQNNLWHEALYTLAQLKQSNPEDQVIAQMWTQLLQSEKLDFVATEPLINLVQRSNTELSHLMGYSKF